GVVGGVVLQSRVARDVGDGEGAFARPQGFGVGRQVVDAVAVFGEVQRRQSVGGDGLRRRLARVVAQVVVVPPFDGRARQAEIAAVTLERGARHLLPQRAELR